MSKDKNITPLECLTLVKIASFLLKEAATRPINLSDGPDLDLERLAGEVEDLAAVIEREVLPK